MGTLSEPVIAAKTRVPSMAGMVRARLQARLEAAWDRPITLVVAPAGSGKTTLLSNFARLHSETDRRVAWYQAASSEADPSALLQHLEETLRQALPGLPAGWNTASAAATALETWEGGPAALIVDDAHTLAGTLAEQTLGELIAYLPPRVHIILSSRRPPLFDLSRWRVADQLTEVGSDDLRFRSWEVEELFVHHYHQRLRPEDLAELARRTDGWAAGLALFYLATRNKTPTERRRVLESLSTRQRDTRDYLTRNVLAELDEDRRDFLVRTSVLGRLSGPWCDALLGRRDGAQVLAELVERHLFLVSDDGGVTYRQHEVLRSYLEELLVERVGEAATRALYHTAGPILEKGGAHAEALRAYCRAQDWVAADRLLGRSGDRVFDSLGTWVEPLPSALADHDAWLLLATARSQVRSGHWSAALASYRRAEAVAVGALVARTSQEERFRLTAWIDPASAAPHTAAGLLRRAMERDPLGVARELEAAAGAAGEPATAQPLLAGEPRLASGFALLVAGHVRDAATSLSSAAESLEGDSVLGRWGAFLGALLRNLVGDPYNDLPASLDALEDIAPPWLGRLLRQLVAGPSPELETQVAAARIDAASTENAWIDLGLLLTQSLVQSLTGELEAAVAGYDEAGELARGLGAPVLAAWAAAGSALVSAAFDPAAASGRAETAAKAARSAGCPGAACLALLVSARLAGSSDWEQAARSFERDGALHMAPAVSCYLDRIAPAGGVSTTTPLHDPARATPSAASPSPASASTPGANAVASNGAHGPGAGPDSNGRHGPRMPIAPVLSPAPATPGAGARQSAAAARGVQPNATAKRAGATVQDLVDAANALSCPFDAYLPPENPPADTVDPVDASSTALAASGQADLMAGGSQSPTAGSGRALEIHREGEPPRVEVLCLGSFSLVVNGRTLDVSAAKPRLRSLLYRLALDTGRPVHRDQLRNALWPDDDQRTGTRNLQVAVSALRQQLESLGGPGAGTIVARRGDAYVLDPGTGDSDLRRFEDAALQGRRARRRGQLSEAIDPLRQALGLYRGELLADEGMSEWVLDERERLRLLAAETAQLLAESLLEEGDPAGTVEVAERGVWIDRYNDRLWRVMIEAHERNGNLAAAARCSRQYATVLDELGVAGVMAGEG